ncbi:MAG: RNA polymerase sigma-70 factor [Chitinophagales bacterium]|nr:RNA polymerase sigma-70 factor [Chitinophagales bacterium]
MDKAGFKNLFNLHYRPLCNFSYRMIHDMDAAEDIVQDVFLKLWHRKDDISFEKSTQSYLYTMVKNRTLGVIRKTDTGIKIYQEFASGTPAYGLQDVDDEEIEKYLLVDEIYKSIRQLPTKCGEIFTLSKINGLTYTQIAEAKGISVKTVENQMGKALRLLRTMLVDKRMLFLIVMIWFN